MAAKRSVGFLRRQHGGRFIEDEDFRATVERFEDLHALPLAHGHHIHARRRVHMQAVLRAQFLA